MDSAFLPPMGTADQPKMCLQATAWTTSLYSQKSPTFRSRVELSWNNNLLLLARNKQHSRAIAPLWSFCSREKYFAIPRRTGKKGIWFGLSAPFLFLFYPLCCRRAYRFSAIFFPSPPANQTNSFRKDTVRASLVRSILFFVFSLEWEGGKTTTFNLAQIVQKARNRCRVIMMTVAFGSVRTGKLFVLPFGFHLNAHTERSVEMRRTNNLSLRLAYAPRTKGGLAPFERKFVSSISERSFEPSLSVWFSLSLLLWVRTCATIPNGPG